MGNLIKDFWTHQNYYGITEVVGGDLQYRKVEGKHETRIEKALEYMLKPDLRLLSHMSVQMHNEYLNKTGRSLRNDNEKQFYPMIFELETKIKPDENTYEEKIFEKQYYEMVWEAYLLVTYLMFEMGMEEKDILIMLNNSRSIYIMINPVSYGLVPGKNLHLIYKEMFNMISENVSLNYADKQMYKSNGLMKTPNCWYKGGYFVPISYGELTLLRNNPGLKAKLTKEKRSLDYEIPGVSCTGLIELFEKAKENIHIPNKSLIQNYNYKNENSNVSYIKGFPQRRCIDYIDTNVIEDGKKNFALVSVGYHYKGLGYSQEKTLEIMNSIADKWEYESPSRIEAKVKSIYKGTKKFSCEKANECLGIDEICKTCQFGNKHQENIIGRFKIQKIVIDRLWENKASLRHYKAYLQLSREDLFNKYFSLEVLGIPERTLKELCKKAGFILSKDDESVMIFNKDKDLNSGYCLLPNEFVDLPTYDCLDEQLKHFLKLLFTGYKLGKNGKYIQTHVSKERIKELLGYETLDGVYKLVKKLSNLGLAVYNKGKLLAIYFSSYKVIEIKNKNKNYGDMDVIQNIENVDDGYSFFVNRNNQEILNTS